MYKINTYLISLIIILAFTEGAISLIGPSESMVKIFRQLLVVVLFFLSLIQSPINKSPIYKNVKNYRYLGINKIFLLFVVAITSMLYNGNSGIEFFLFFLRVLPAILFFWSVFIISFNISYVLTILKLMVIIQIPAIIFKYFVMGVSESGGIGTMSIHAGSLSTIFPLFVISFAFAYYLSRKNKWYLFVVSVYLIFGLIGGKRALVAYVPLLFVIILFYYKIGIKSKLDASFFRQMIVIFLLGFISFYFIVRFNPNLNPEQKVWGSFDVEYVMNVSEEYNSSTIELGFSRSDAPEVVYTFLTSKNDIMYLLFGLGPGDIIQSSLNNKYPGVANDRQLLMHKYGLGYGLRVGMLWTTMQVGVLGALIYALFILKIVRNLIRVLKSSKILNHKEFCLGVLAMGVIVLIDYFSYSSTFFYSGAISNSFFLLAAIVFKRNLLETRVLLFNRQVHN